MSDLAVFLLARLGEIEADARVATPGPWEWQTFHETDELVHPVMLGRWSSHPMNVLKSSHEHWPPNSADKAHIVRHDPARVLADCMAKRAIVELHEPGLELVGIDDSGEEEWRCPECGLPLFDGRTGCRTLRLLASPFVDHPDFDPAWTVTA